MLPNLKDTIAAIATAQGIGAIGMVRVSGAEAFELVNQLFGGKDLRQQPPNTLHYGKIREADGHLLDEVVVSLFRAPHSYTKEDVVEITAHGSPYILNRIVQRLGELGARPAEPGEFTLRAFMNGGLDLSQAEAVADLIASRSATSQQLAMAQLRGGVSDALKDIRERLLNFASLVELELDFSEDDVEFADLAELRRTVTEARQEVGRLIASFSSGNALKRGIPTVIAGKPNAGKSTLMNRILADERAIVSEIPGTTRDVIEDTFFIEGYEFRLIDTAGLREALDPIEAEGVNRSKAKLETAAITLFLYDASQDSYDDAMAYWQSLELPDQVQLITVANKIDLTEGQPAGPQQEPSHNGSPFVALSALNDSAIDPLLEQMVATARAMAGNETSITNERHLHALQRADEALANVEQALQAELPGEMLAVDMRVALDALGEITGEVTTDEILGNIFSKFCIGK
jgi:tRNA modification GTPase